MIRDSVDTLNTAELYRLVTEFEFHGSETSLRRIGNSHSSTVPS